MMNEYHHPLTSNTKTKYYLDDGSSKKVCVTSSCAVSSTKKLTSKNPKPYTIFFLDSYNALAVSKTIKKIRTKFLSLSLSLTKVENAPYSHPI